MQADTLSGLALGLTAIFAALGALVISAVFHSWKTPSGKVVFQETDLRTMLLFDGETLIDSTPGGKSIINSSPVSGTAWVRMLARLGRMFPDLDRHLASLPQTGEISLSSDQGSGDQVLLQAELRGGLTRIWIGDGAVQAPLSATDPFTHRAVNEELGDLRDMLSHAPLLAWRERENGDVIWANAAYVLAASERLAAGQDLTWPLPRLFDRLAVTQGSAGQRQCLRMPDAAECWYELSSTPSPSGFRVFAVPCDSAVQAEATLREFMQTLTRTFAHLPIGLAIFDAQRTLQLFNPALVDLTGLPPDFLALRPSLRSVLDGLRARGVVPEPKDFRDWRQQILDLENTARTTPFEETWSLSSGQTYRVTGRPHPNGAIAFILEDISTEVSRTRRYRADLELGQSVIDMMNEGLAVFSESGSLVMSNMAYSRLWGHDPSVSLSDMGISALAQYWRRKTAPDPVWSEVEDFICTIERRETWSSEIRMLDGRLIEFRLVPLTGGGSLIGFCESHTKTGHDTTARQADRRSA